MIEKQFDEEVTLQCYQWHMEHVGWDVREIPDLPMKPEQFMEVFEYEQEQGLIKRALSIGGLVQEIEFEGRILLRPSAPSYDLLPDVLH